MPEALTFIESPPRSIAAITALGDTARVRAALETEFSIALPSAAGFVRAGEITLSRLSPTRFLAAGESGADLPERLAGRLGGIAAITDQSDLWAYFTLTGPAGSAHLAGVVPIDLDPRKFPVGALGLTRGGHLDIRLWHIAPHTYELAVPRSYALDLRDSLTRSIGRG